VPPIPDPVERSHAIISAGDRFPVDNAGTRAQLCHSLDNEGKTVGQIVAGTAVEPNPIALLASDKPKTIVLDLVQPLLAARRSFRAAGKTWRDKAQVEDRNATACTLIESYVATIRNRSPTRSWPNHFTSIGPSICTIGQRTLRLKLVAR
jgi:hypothetical protein